jgi:hypothetical protein
MSNQIPDDPMTDGIDLDAVSRRQKVAEAGPYEVVCNDGPGLGVAWPTAGEEVTTLILCDVPALLAEVRRLRAREGGER